jgi:(4-alkanoyl-5-oxo-2,5-dihydrofuran-3-yl)methyl phosphate reductase
MILVIGATGTVGREVTQQLVDARRPVRALVRAAARAQKLGPKVELAKGDAADRKSLDAALGGVESVFVCLPMSPEVPQLERNVYDAARAARTKHVVKISGGGGGATLEGLMRGTPYAEWHRQGEQYLADTRASWTVLRPGTFDSNATRSFGITQRDGLFLPAGNGKDAHIDPRDIAAVAVKILTTPEGHAGKTYELTGPELLSYGELVERINLVTGKSFRYQDVSDTEWSSAMLGAGAPTPIVESMLRYFAGLREGRMYVTTTVPELLGRPAGSVEGWIRDHASEFEA